VASVAYLRRGTATWRRTYAGLLVSPSPDSELLLLGPPADRIWALLETPATVEELVERLCSEFTAESDAIRRDVEEFVTDLERRGAVVRR
jgi:hypothetical protein